MMKINMKQMSEEINSIEKYGVQISAILSLIGTFLPLYLLLAYYGLQGHYDIKQIQDLGPASD